MLRLRTASEPKSARFDVLGDGGGILAAWFTDKGAKSAVQLQLDRIPDEAVLAERKALWKTRLDALAKRVKDRR